MSEDETLKAVFAFFGFSRRSTLVAMQSPLTLWLFFIGHLAPKARQMKSKLHATQENSHAVTTIASAINLSWFDNGCVTPLRSPQARGKVLQVIPSSKLKRASSRN
jgi:hypothetical protein